MVPVQVIVTGADAAGEPWLLETTSLALALEDAGRALTLIDPKESQ